MAAAGSIVEGSRKPEITPLFCPASRGTSVGTTGTSVTVPASRGPQVLVSQDQLPQLPPTLPDGPVEVPMTQRLSPGHQPHCDRCVQELQSVALPHTSPASAPRFIQLLLNHAHEPVPQVLPFGPVLVPTWQRPVVAHQPHCERWVQAPHEVALLQGSPASPVVMHEERVHDHAEAQVDPVGPVLVPLWHRPVAPHQPHWLSAVQVSHARCAAQGSTAASIAGTSVGGATTSTAPASVAPVSGGPASGAAHIAALWVHPAPQAPVVGPVALPATQAPVSPHHPQGPSAAQVAQLVTAPQFTACIGISGAATTSTRSGFAEASPITVSVPLEQAAETTPIKSAEVRREGRMDRTGTPFSAVRARAARPQFAREFPSRRARWSFVSVTG